MRRIDRLLKETSVRERTAYQMHEALTHHYLGRGSKAECLDKVNGISETTYYRLRNEHPELAEVIENSARREAVYRVDGETIAFQARQKRISRLIQERAAEALLDPQVMEIIVDLALGKPRTVTVGGEEKHIIVYPRNQLNAIALLQDLAREGVLPETEISLDDLTWLDRPREKEETSLDFLLGMGVPTHFNTVTAKAGDGRDTTVGVHTKDLEPTETDSGCRGAPAH